MFDVHSNIQGRKVTYQEYLDMKKQAIAAWKCVDKIHAVLVDICSSSYVSASAPSLSGMKSSAMNEASAEVDAEYNKLVADISKNLKK